MEYFEKPDTYAAKHPDANFVSASQSGGMFASFSQFFLDIGGVVYGCVLDKDFYARHDRATNDWERDAMRRSKYIASTMGENYKRVKADLEAGKRVLFSGTSCQVAGLKKFLGRDYNNLLCVDIICHGVPSPLVWQKFLTWKEKEQGSKVVAVNFRNKADFGWHSHVETLLFENGKRLSGTVFATLFYSHMALRPCCYKCRYKHIIHPGDITISDYWGIENNAPELDDNKGTSLVLINNQQGRKFFEFIKESLIYKQTRIETSLQEPLIAPFKSPKGRDKFWREFHKYGDTDFRIIANRYGGAGFFQKIRRRLGGIKRKIIGILK